MPYEVKLKVFEGPLDLLLQLITRQRVDIYDVSISTITDEYLKALEDMTGLDLESATGFLVVAASLLELKSARLLPSLRLDADDAMLEERDLLLARLVECATYREAGTWLAGGLAAGGAFHGRTAGLDPSLMDRAPDLLARVTVADLIAAAEALVPAPEPALDLSHVAPITASVKDALVRVAARLKQGPAAFSSLCGPTATRIEAVVCFLALLELYKAGAVELTQAACFGEIEASWTGAAEADELIEGIDEYVLEAEV